MFQSYILFLNVSWEISWKVQNHSVAKSGCDPYMTSFPIAQKCIYVIKTDGTRLVVVFYGFKFISYKYGCNFSRKHLKSLLKSLTWWTRIELNNKTLALIFWLFKLYILNSNKSNSVSRFTFNLNNTLEVALSCLIRKLSNLEISKFVLPLCHKIIC